MFHLSPIRLAASAALVLGVGFGVADAGASVKPVTPTVHAVFVETDAAAGNRILSYWRAADGSVARAGQYPTGGKGAAALNAVADPLASQGGLALVDHNSLLVAVNAGSDTVTLFAVDGTSLTALQQIGSGGSFPDSVASHGDLVAVLNAGGNGSVKEFRIFDDKLVPLPDENRSLGLSNTTPPDYVHGAGQVGYTPDGTHLVVTTKHSTDSYEVFSVSAAGVLGATPTVTAADNAVPFAFSFDASGNLVGAEASNSSVSTYHVNADGSLTSLGTVTDGEKALCWIASAKGYFFGDNAGSATVSAFNEGAGDAPQLVNADAANAHAGTTDVEASPDGDFLYVESGGAGTLDVFGVGAGTLTPIETVYNLPVAAEGLAVS